MSNNATVSPSASKADESEGVIMLHLHQEREYLFKNSYGEDKLDQVLAFDEQMLKTEFDAYNHKVKLLEPIFQQRSEFIKKYPGFWLKVMTNDPQTNDYIDAIDRDALGHLEDLTLDHDPTDARNITFHFHFAKGNPYFSNRTLSKKFTVVAEDPNELPPPNGSSSVKINPKISEMNKKYDLDRAVESAPVKIDWASKEHDLVAKKPWPSPDSIDADEIDEVINNGVGSFFNFFGAETDRFNLHTILLDMHAKALDYYAGLIDPTAEDISDDEEEDEDEDPNQVVDLESETDEPQKKKAKTSS